MKTIVIIKLTVEGLHRWKDCDIESVKYLSSMHRHLFHIECGKTVSHSNREIEIISFKQDIETYLMNRYGKPCLFNSKSCEMIAEELLTAFKLEYCKVLEDNENGAEVRI